MKTKDIANLMNRAAAYIEDPKSINPLEVKELVEDLTSAADDVEKSREADNNKALQNALNNSDRVLKEVNEILTEMGWQSDRGVLYRVREVQREIKELRQ